MIGSATVFPSYCIRSTIILSANLPLNNSLAVDRSAHKPSYRYYRTRVRPRSFMLSGRTLPGNLWLCILSYILVTSAFIRRFRNNSSSAIKALYQPTPHRTQVLCAFNRLNRLSRRLWTLSGIRFDRSPPSEAISRMSVELVNPYCSLVMIKIVSIPATARFVIAS